MYIVEVVASCVSAAEVAPAYGPRVVDGRVETVTALALRLRVTVTSKSKPGPKCYERALLRAF